MWTVVGIIVFVLFAGFCFILCRASSLANRAEEEFFHESGNKKAKGENEES